MNTAKTDDIIINNKKRDELFEKYMPLANKIAYTKQKMMPRCVRIDDIKSAAYMGLLDAAARYDETKHEQFIAYARIRIIGEINDYLRTCTWGNRKHSFYSWSLDVPVYGSRSRNSIPLKDSLTSEPEVTKLEIDEFFAELTKTLPRQIKNIMRYYFLDGLTMKEISLLEGMCESRISQLISYYKSVLQENWAGKEVDLFDHAKSSNSIVREKYKLNLSDNNNNMLN